MKIIESIHKLNVDNLDEAVGAGIGNNMFQKHGPLLPSSIRGLIVGL